MNDIDAILFDLDGTLTDSGPSIMNCYRYTFDKLGFDCPPDHVLRSFVGPPLNQNMESVVGPELVADAIKHYLYHMVDEGVGLSENKLYAGVPDLLTTLKSAGKNIYLATSKRHPLCDDVLIHFDLMKYFSAVHGCNRDGSQSDKALVVAKALASAGCKPDRAIMVGDRYHDIVGAKKNGLQSIGVLWGYGSRQELEEAGADYIVETRTELTTLLLAA
ncbi:MAG: HAD family hydrolase [Proteobacteria bacterium]|jgi:phosphoglycolate phosphatase|nr:HAD hydrolase-like protein [Alphaproteobacteria bacterium]NCC02625.1 HAD family hydrolase [Pseudomonadota bacterium]